ncbi:DUF2953 domain-containing protein [Natribacillus halophilus]|uniref:DUF2953 domain-containing protein n=1 Tax=Natribacillus halophilus TaxID=549003 RepID=A0A1G8NE00_9BACI|nr:DUF2953 domain-containing protein [Natribacillus halophilus]SDI78375.1 Protein of unknown function [Natribacillus halophilus]
MTILQIKTVIYMTWVLVGFIIVTFLLILCLFLRVRVHISYQQQGQDNDGSLTVSILRGLIKKQWEVPTMKMDEDSFSMDYEAYSSGLFSKKKKKKQEKKGTLKDVEKQREYMQTTLHHVAGFTRILRRFLKNVRVREFRWETVIGTGDAASTGTLSGVAWTGKSALFALVAEKMSVRHLPDLKVTPLFQAAFFHTSLSCIVTFSVGNAMRALIQVLIHARIKDEPASKHKPEDRNVSKEA